MKKRNEYKLLCGALLITGGLQAHAYDGPDFNGDGVSDLGQVWNDDGRLSVGVLLSGTDGFVEQRWVSKSGNYDQSQRWFHGDFNGDQISDAACLRDDGGAMSCDVYLSTDTNADFLNDTFEKSAWAVQSGTFSYSDQWFAADFNHDYKTDLARVYNDGGKRSVVVYLSNGTGFDAPATWADQQGVYHADDVWLTGAFDSVAGIDFAVISAGSDVNIDLLLSSGVTFNSSNLVYDAGPRLSSMKWVAEDFNGDGATEIASLWNDKGAVSINVHGWAEDCFTNEHWVVQQGVFEREHRWFIGDFNGDALVDVARLWNDDGKLSIEHYESDGQTFAPRMVLKQGRTYRDQDVYVVGDFNGDFSSDLAVTWADGEQWHSDVILSTRGESIVKSSSFLPLDDYFERHALVRAIESDTFMTYSKLVGATPVGADLQAVLDSGNDLLLVKNEIYDTSHTLKYQATYQRIQTMDALFLNDFAMLREQIDQGDYDSLIIGNGQDYIHLENVMVNGNKYKLNQKGKSPIVAQGAMVIVSDSVGAWLRRCIFYNARTWSTCQLNEAGHSHIVEHNYVLGAGDDPRGCGRYVDQNGHGKSGKVSIGWSDGFSIGAANVTARYNFIMDCTDVGMVLFGAPGSHVHDNLILNYSRDNHGGINMVDGITTWHMGTDSTFDGTYECYDYRGNIIEDNRIVASGCRIQIGMPLGNRIWKPTTPQVFDMNGGVIRNNILEGNSMGYGFVLDYAKNVDFYGNKSIATHTGKGRGSNGNGKDPDPASAFLYNPETVHVAPDGQLQPEFQASTKRIEHYLFHNGTPLSADRYHYYSYTEIEVIEMVKASYLEMLGRAPAAQELKDGAALFLVDPKPETPINEAYKQYGDAFKRELMKRPEFVAKFGAVPTQYMQPLRTTRWRDRLNANDVRSLLNQGQFVNPKSVYDDVLEELVLQSTGADSILTAISPALPEKMKSGESARISVTVKNTGTIVWENRANDPRKFALAAVGGDTTFGMTRAYIPNGIQVRPGETYTFEMDLKAPPIAYAGRGNPNSTPMPYDLKMIQESVGFFGGTLTDLSGATVQIAVAHVEEPPPIPLYNATFVEQTLPGNPQLNGIRPGAEFSVNLTFKNAGNSTTYPWTKAGGFTLGSENTKDNHTWGSNRISLEKSHVVEYGETVTLQAILRAPKEEGEYNFQWQMLGNGWFGQFSDNLVIPVRTSAPVISLTDAQFVSISVPEQVRAGKSFMAEVTFKNSGETPWVAGELAAVSSMRDRTDQQRAMITSEHADSIPEETAGQLFDNDTATKYFTRNAAAWVQHQFAQGTSFNIVNYAITSAPDEGPGPELLDNGSFEEGAAGWNLSKSSISTDHSVSGDSCLKLALMDGKNTGNTTIAVDGLKADTDYVFSFWMRQQPDTQGLFVLDTNDVYDRTCQWAKNGGQPTEWTRYRGVFNSGVVDSDKKTPNSGSLSLRIRASDLVGAIYLDDLSLVEVGGGGGGGDPHSWTLQGSNDGDSWSMVDEQAGISFPERSQRLMFDVSTPGAHEYYKLHVQNLSGDTLQFSELELLTDSQDQIRMTPVAVGKTVSPGQKHTFKLQLNAPAVPGEYTLQTRMQTGEFGFGSFTPNQTIMVTGKETTN